jgi:hypothetical protein
MKSATQNEIDRFKKGESFDWQGITVKGSAIAKAIVDATITTSGLSLEISSATIEGDIDASDVGRASQVNSLSFINCTITGAIICRNSTWQNLSIINCKVDGIDFSGSTISKDVTIKKVACSSPLKLPGCQLGGRLDLSESIFFRGQENYAIDISECSIARRFEAVDLTAKATIIAQQLKVTSDIIWDGVHIEAVADQTIALELSSASISGEIKFRNSASRLFQSQGIVVLRSTTARALLIYGAKLNGKGRPSLVCDQVAINDSVDLRSSGTSLFETIGPVRFVAARIGRQFQIVDANLSAPNDSALNLDGTDIGADVLLGFAGHTLRLEGEISLRSATIRGRLLACEAQIDAIGASFSLRQCNVVGEVSLYDITARGGLDFFLLRARRVAICNLILSQQPAQFLSEHPPETFAQPQDALLDLGYSQIETDVYIEKLTITGGDFRIINARISGGVQVIQFSINSERHGLIAQGAHISRGLHLAGTDKTPSVILGTVNVMEARIDGGILFANVEIGNKDKKSEFHMRDCRVASVSQFYRTKIYGPFEASAARFSSDLIFNGTEFLNEGDGACDLRYAQIDGVFQIASLLPPNNPSTARLSGTLTTDGATFGAVEWHSLHMENNSQLILNNSKIAGKLRAGLLLPKGHGIVDLTGTIVSELNDALDEKQDSWGAGKLSLRLNGFQYRRLTYPSGRQSAEAPRDIRIWRSKWFSRSVDKGSGHTARHLAKVLRDAGMFEASRLILIDAFAVEGKNSPNKITKFISYIWGLMFGYGLSGVRALATLIIVWGLGTVSVILLQRDGYMIVSSSEDVTNTACGNTINPAIYAADIMIPVLDLGEEKLCQIGLSDAAGPDSVFASAEFAGAKIRFSRWNVFRFLGAVYAVIGWVVVSMALATWSGVFRRAGRD